MEPKNSFSKRCKVAKFLMFPIGGGIGLMRLLADKSRTLRDLNNPISWEMELESSF